MKARLWTGLERPQHPPGIIITWSVQFDGIAHDIVSRYSPFEYTIRIPANDRDSFRW